MAEAEQTVQRSRGLVAVDEAELGDAKRKLAPQRTQAANQLMCPGQLTGFSARASPSTTSIPSRKTLQWPLRSQTGWARTWGLRTSR